MPDVDILRTVGELRGLVFELASCTHVYKGDVLTRREPTIFKPGTPSALAALAGCLVFLLLVYPLHLPGGLAGLISVGIVFGIRVIAVRFDLRTRPAIGYGHNEDSR